MSTLQKLVDKRKAAGLELYRRGNVSINNNVFLVTSARDPATQYFVMFDECSCPDHQRRGKEYVCKHRVAVDYFMEEMLAK